MSWLFGKKKHRESPPETPNEPANAGSDDSFIFVERRENPSNPQNPNLYPMLNNMSMYPPMPVHPSASAVTKQISQDSSNSDLSLIPFKFCKALERSRNNDFDIDKLRVGEIESFLKRIDQENYSYEFQLERSIINEMNSQVQE